MVETGMMSVRRPGSFTGVQPPSQESYRHLGIIQTSALPMSDHDIRKVSQGFTDIARVPNHGLQTNEPCFHLYEDKESISSLASSSHYRNGRVSCLCATTGKSIRLHMSKWFRLDIVLTSANTFFNFISFFKNCTLQHHRIIVTHSVIIGRILVF